MRLTQIVQIKNFRSFIDVGPLELGALTLFVGPNNSGKSAILQSVLALQQSFELGPRHVRLGERLATVLLKYEGPGQLFAPAHENLPSEGRIFIRVPQSGQAKFSLLLGQNDLAIDRVQAREPDHLIVPYLSRRRPEVFSEDVKLENANAVHSDMRYLAAKLSRVAQPSHPRYELYSKACKEIVGVVVTAVPSVNGQMPGVFVGAGENIPLADMGAGVSQIVGLLADLALADNKIFVIEEPENDLHPAALRALLDLVAEASDRNQFLVSTHSNLVLRHLGSQPDSRIYQVNAEFHGAWPPETIVTEVPAEPEARSQVLIDLGYELRDFEFFDGWLFLEEASAERIIRDFLIPWFAPELAGRIRTVSARGASRVEPTFEDFNRLVLFTHLESRYQNRAWVLVDGDKIGKHIVSSLRERYASRWEPSHFRAFSEEAFESYYPERFQPQVAAALEESDPQRRRQLKKALLDDVRSWAQEDSEGAKNAFAESAAEVIGVLREIEEKFTS
jgi:AAA domain, putative AbiEii toxin, Type IV TA system/AAA ATPase domain